MRHRRPAGLSARRTAAGCCRSPAGARSGEPARAEALAPEPAPATPDAGSVDEAALAELVAQRIERTEARLVGLLGSLEDIVTRLTDRLERLEDTLDDPGDPGDRRPDRRSLPHR